MKRILLIFLAIAAASQLVAAQKSGTAGKSANAAAAAVKWNKVTPQKWGVESLDVPDNLVAKPDEISSSSYTAIWAPNRKKSGPKITEVNLNVTTWDMPFEKIDPDLKPELATPENFIALDAMANLRAKKEKPSQVLEAGYYEIDGVKGSYTALKYPNVKPQLILGWITFRLYKGKPQRITFQITAGLTEREAAVRILDSLRLEKPSN